MSTCMHPHYRTIRVYCIQNTGVYFMIWNQWKNAFTAFTPDASSPFLSSNSGHPYLTLRSVSYHTSLSRRSIQQAVAPVHSRWRRR